MAEIFAASHELFQLVDKCTYSSRVATQFQQFRHILRQEEIPTDHGL